MFAIRHLSVHTYTNGQTIWAYKSDDTIAQILADGYFNDASDMLHPCDIIFITGTLDEPRVAMRQISTTRPNVTLSAIL